MSSHMVQVSRYSYKPTAATPAPGFSGAQGLAGLQ